MKNGSPLQIEYRSTSELLLDPKNPRTHSAKQVAQIAASIETFGFVNPVLIDEASRVIAGHGRIAAAKQLSLGVVPTIAVQGLTEAQKKALVIADNKIALNAGWDEDLLVEALGEIVLDTEFDLGAIGYETAELDNLLDRPQKVDPADSFEEPDPARPTVTRLGDVWILGEHRLLCGNALEASSFEAVMQRESAQMVLTDAPFNVKIAGHVSVRTATRHAEFAMASGEMSKAQFTEFLATAFRHIARYSVDGAVVMAFMDWRHMDEILTAGRAAFSELLNLCVWNKSNGGMGSLYRSKHELIFVFKSGTGRHINNVELGKHGRSRMNVWDYAGANAFGRHRDQDLEDHPTVKPIAMIVDAIKDCSKRGGLILDPFGGSGTTLLAAERTGRRARLVELDPGYVDVTVRRWLTLTKGRQPILEATGETFDVVAARRAEEDAGRPESIGQHAISKSSIRGRS